MLFDFRDPGLHTSPSDLCFMNVSSRQQQNEFLSWGGKRLHFADNVDYKTKTFETLTNVVKLLCNILFTL